MDRFRILHKVTLSSGDKFLVQHKWLGIWWTHAERYKFHDAHNEVIKLVDRSKRKGTRVIEIHWA